MSVEWRKGEKYVWEESYRWSQESKVLFWSILLAITSPEAIQYDKVSGFTTLAQIEWMKRLYQGSDDVNEEIRSLYLYSPLNTPDEILLQYPPTLLILAKYDVLTVEGKEFQKKLDLLGVRTRLEEYNTTIHAFFTGHPILGPRALKRSVELLKEIMI